MATQIQAANPITVTTPLGPDVLLTGFTGHEAISQLFSFHIDMIAEHKVDVPFEKLLGQKITVTLWLPEDKKRFFNGICKHISHGHRDQTYNSYRVEIVPQFWSLTKKAQSRIFQHLTVPDILQKVLQGLDVSFEIKGAFQPRDFCVQYRETDFNFASRLMEEEGIYYFFKHSSSGHKMVVTNEEVLHPDMPDQNKFIFEELAEGKRDELRVFSWEKIQELRSGKYTLWDHTFELPHKHLEASQPILNTPVPVGKVNHKLNIANDKLEVYDYPGAYAQRFDGVDKGGGDQPADLQKIFQDNKRTVKIRMEEETTPAILIRGASNCRNFVSGHDFTLERHFNADGQYLLISVHHSARLEGNYRSGGTSEFIYQNTFTCIPSSLPFRPPRVAGKPVVEGTQTAVVVGPAGEEIFTDKYGRVKVQFHWDREGKNNPDSSCWLRVATPWAGKQWGVIHIPRVGQEVVVDFLEGDPDQPIIVGSVYNADMMPPYKLPANKTQSGVVSRSTLGGDPETFNEFCFEDKKGEELVYLRAEKDHIVAVEHDEYDWNGHDHWNTVDNDEKTEIGSNRTESVGANESISIGGNRTETVSKDETVTIKGKRTVSVMKDESLAVGQKRETGITANDTLTIGGSLVIAVANAITMTCGASSLEMKKDGTITLKGMDVTVQASMGLKLKGMDVSSEATKAHTTKGLTVSVEAQTSLSLKGLTASLEGQTTTDVKGLATTVTGNGTATLTAPLVRVEASGVAMISGALVKI